MFLYLQAMLSSYKSISALRLHKHPKQGKVVSKIINFHFESLGEILQCDFGTIYIPRPKARRKCGELRSPNCQNVMMRKPFATGTEFDMF